MPILLMENHASLRKPILLMLRSQGHNVVAAEDGSKALKLLQGTLFDLVITSLMTGQMRVAEFATAVKNLQPKALIIVAGRYFGPAPKIPCVDAVMQYPISLHDLKLAVRVLLPEPSMQSRDGQQASYLRMGRTRLAQRINKVRG